jgi:hypothetical protein
VVPFVTSFLYWRYIRVKSACLAVGGGDDIVEGQFYYYYDPSVEGSPVLATPPFVLSTPPPPAPGRFWVPDASDLEILFAAVRAEAYGRGHSRGLEQGLEQGRAEGRAAHVEEIRTLSEELPQ